MKKIRHLQKQLCLTDQIIVESEDIFWYFFYFVFRDIYFRDITFSRYLFSRFSVSRYFFRDFIFSRFSLSRFFFRDFFFRKIFFRDFDSKSRRTVGFLKFISFIFILDHFNPTVRPTVIVLLFHLFLF